VKKLVIIGANDFQNQLIKKARCLGYETHVFAWEEGAVGKENADYFYPLSITEKEQILEICKRIMPCGVCSIASDLAAITVNYVAEGLGLPCNQTRFTKMQTNKYEMRKALVEAGIRCPAYIKTYGDISENLLKNFHFPIIVKPTDRSGSRCVTKLESVTGLTKAVRNACDVSFEKSAIIEEYIDGDEYSMETVTQNGEHHYLATTRKFTTGAPHFIETGHRQPSGLNEETIERAKSTVFEALTALHVENSAGHSEFRIDAEGNIKLIEIGARMGGDCIGSDLVFLSTGYDFTKMVIDVAVGNPLMFQSGSHHMTAEVRFLLTEKDMAIFEEKKKQGNIYRISDMCPENCGNVTDSSSRIGYYICYE